MKILTKSLYLLFTLCLLAFAALQFNDPDPMTWILFYVICASVPALALANRPMDSVFWIALVVCGIALAIYASGAYNYYLHRNEEPLMQSMNPEKPYIEEAREFLGALIATVFVVISHVLAHYRKKN